MSVNELWLAYTQKSNHSKVKKEFRWNRTQDLKKELPRYRKKHLRNLRQRAVHEGFFIEIS